MTKQIKYFRYLTAVISFTLLPTFIFAQYQKQDAANKAVIKMQAKKIDAYSDSVKKINARFDSIELKVKKIQNIGETVKVTSVRTVSKTENICKYYYRDKKNNKKYFYSACGKYKVGDRVKR